MFKLIFISLGFLIGKSYEQECSITYQNILLKLASQINDNGCGSYITIFDSCLTETINLVKNQQQQPFQPYIIPQEGSVQNVQFLMQQDFNYLTVQSQEVFFNCIIRKQSLHNNDDNDDNDAPPPSQSPTPIVDVPEEPPQNNDQNPSNPFMPDILMKKAIIQSTVEEFKCNNFDEKTIGNVRYVNNQWGIGKSPQTPKQCLLKGQNSDDETFIGWNWEYSGCDFSVFAYPEILYGDKPWSNEASTDPKFSTQIKNFQQLDIYLETESINLEGTYNLALEIWTTDTPKPPNNNNAIISEIKTEVMWIIDLDGLATPAGQKIAETTIDGVKWNLSLLARRDQVFWDFYTFSTQFNICDKENGSSKCKFQVNAKKFFDYLISEGFANPDEYIEVVELGNEIMGNCDNSGPFGTGQTFVKDFRVEYKNSKE